MYLPPPGVGVKERGSEPPLPSSAEEIVVLFRCKVILCTCLAAQMLTVGNLLQVVQRTRDALVARAVERILSTKLCLMAINSKTTMLPSLARF